MPFAIGFTGTDPADKGKMIIDRNNLIFVFFPKSKNTADMKACHLRNNKFFRHANDALPTLSYNRKIIPDGPDHALHSVSEHVSEHDREPPHCHFKFENPVNFVLVAQTLLNLKKSLTAEALGEFITPQYIDVIIHTTEQYFRELATSPTAERIEREYRHDKENMQGRYLLAKQRESALAPPSLSHAKIAQIMKVVAIVDAIEAMEAATAATSPVPAKPNSDSKAAADELKGGFYEMFKQAAKPAFLSATVATAAPPTGASAAVTPATENKDGGFEAAFRRAVQKDPRKLASAVARPTVKTTPAAPPTNDGDTKDDGFAAAFKKAMQKNPKKLAAAVERSPEELAAAKRSTEPVGRGGALSPATVAAILGAFSRTDLNANANAKTGAPAVQSTALPTKSLGASSSS